MKKFFYYSIVVVVAVFLAVILRHFFAWIGKKCFTVSVGFLVRVDKKFKTLLIEEKAAASPAAEAPDAPVVENES